MDVWGALFDLLVLLGAALLLGTLCERLRQNAILGYLLAGMLLGPNTLNVISNEQQVRALAELGVALLLFTIGLEFSWRHLRRLGEGPRRLGRLLAAAHLTRHRPRPARQPLLSARRK